ncbi:MAG: hypothetical protein A3H41_01975 [Omnitrophica WOR_2 bacterium RIFCSPLOWO2_02_FULL_45_28]|nr:MAG: hypothetical protein A3H41_01975 [Omnitrophica WOR_2 bacterium RIFCSPLOWO2_02_FULL_45_28]
MSKGYRGKSYILLSAACCLLSVVSGCSLKPYHKETRIMMGTFVEITCQDKAAMNAAFEEIKKIENIANKFEPASEISRLNKNGEIKASADFLNLIKESKKYYALSGGAFDITVSPLVDTWKNKIKEAQEKKSAHLLPAEDELEDKLALVGSDKIFINEQESLIKFTQAPLGGQAGMSIDLGGIAKGYAVDKAVLRLKGLGINSCLVNAGGNIYCLGRKGKRKWHIGIQHPRNPEKLLFYLDLENQAVATSGDYQQYFIAEGKRYSHIIDPKTGYPVNNGLASVTIIAEDAAAADALSTTVFVLGKEKGRELLDKIGNVQARIIEEKDI